MIKRIIFDVDKTLIGETDFTKTVVKVLKKYNMCNSYNINGFKKAMEEYDLTHDYYSRSEYLNFINSHIDRRMYLDFLCEYFEELRYAVPSPIPGVKESLENLKNAGFELVCLTNYFAKPQRSRLETLGLSEYIDKIYGEYSSKPMKASYLLAAGSNNMDECVMVGDNFVVDVEVPNYLGFKTIYVTGKDEKLTDKYIEVPSVSNITPKLIKSIK